MSTRSMETRADNSNKSKEKVMLQNSRTVPETRAVTDVRDNHKTAFIIKKAEKLTAALYLVTNAFSAEEPLKWRLRECGLGILTKSLSLIASPDRHFVLKKVVASYIGDLLSYFEVAQRTGIVSEMNAHLLTLEYQGFLEKIQGFLLSDTDQSQTFAVSRDFFEVEDSPVPMSAIGHDTSMATMQRQKDSSTHESEKERQETIRHREGASYEEKKEISVSFLGNPRSMSRRQMILDLLKTKQPISVRDVKDLIANCSEKTLQRELLGMVAEGVLRKEGERRWSVYYVAENSERQSDI